MKKSYLFAGVSILFWSTMAVVTKLLLGELNNIQLLWASSLFAALFLIVTNVINGSIKKLKSYSVKDYVVSALIGLPGTLLYYLFYYAGADIMPASQAFIVNYMWPIMSVVFACILLKEKMTLRKAVAIAISFLGVVIVTSGDVAQITGDTVTGAAFCLLGAVSYGVFTALNQKISYDKSLSMMISYFATFILTGIINFANGGVFIPDFTQVLGFAWNGILTMAVANTLWILALESGKTARISNLAYITPFLSLVWTSLILKEDVSVYSVIGLVVLVLGIFIQLSEKREEN